MLFRRSSALLSLIICCMSIRASLLRLAPTSNASYTKSLFSWPPPPFEVTFYDRYIDKVYDLTFVTYTEPPQLPDSEAILESLKSLIRFQKLLNPNDSIFLENHVFENLILNLEAYWTESPIPRHVFIRLIQVVGGMFFRNGPIRFGSWIALDEDPIASFDLSF